MKRSVHTILAVGLLATLGAGVGLSGCFFDPGYDDCSLYPGAGCGSTQGDGGPANCDPTKGAVDESCGVFVAASAAGGGKGTKASPYNTLAAAAGVHGVKRVYLCAETHTETATVSFSGGVEIYAGFANCASASGWAWHAAAQATLNGPADVPALVLAGGASRIENLKVVAAPATVAGGSSIALIVSGGSLEMTNGSLTAGDAKDGDPGTHLDDDTKLDGEQGEQGKNTCDPGASHLGAQGGTKSCSTGGSSTAGNGGDGGQVVSATLQPAGSGSDGSPSDAGQPTKGKGGVGEGQGTPAATSCESGADGANGAAGTSGAGATGPGVIIASGYTGTPGGDGSPGKPGQGGGGGGAAMGAATATCSGTSYTNLTGASGGAGGTGGCGGALGGGGNSGGSSIALVSLGATITLTQVTLSAGKGGGGGKGGDGQSGGHKGTGGQPGSGGSANDACAGGYGGKGGNGGPGGGGQGGHSLGIAYKGTAPTGGTFNINPANNGKGGAGGTGNTSANGGQGEDGKAANALAFQ